MVRSEGVIETVRYTCTKKGMKKHPQGNWYPWQLHLETLMKKIEVELKLNKYILKYGDEI